MSYLYGPQTHYCWPSPVHEQARPQFSNGGNYAQTYHHTLRDSSISSYIPSTTCQNYASYQPQPATPTNYHSPTNQNNGFFAVNNQQQSYSVPVANTQNRFSLAPQQTQYTSYHTAAATSQGYQNSVPSWPTAAVTQLASFPPTRDYQGPVQITSKPYQQPIGQTLAADPLRQSYLNSSGIYSTPIGQNDSSYLSNSIIRGNEPLRASYHSSLSAPQVQLHGRSNSVGQKVIENLRGSFHFNQESEIIKSRPSVSFDRRTQPATVENILRTSFNQGNQPNSTYISPHSPRLYDRPSVLAPDWNFQPTAINGIQTQPTNLGTTAAGNTTRGSSLNRSQTQGVDESFHQTEVHPPKADSRPSSYKPHPVMGDQSVSPRSLSPENKQKNPLMFPTGTPSTKAEYRNLEIPNTPSSFIISENSSPTTPDSRSQSTHGKSLRSIKLFETPAQQNHAYPNVGHQPFNPPVALSASNSMASLPPVKIDIHTDSCYNYLNKRMYNTNHDTHTPLEQFFFRESVGQHKVAQTLAPLLPTVQIPTPLKIQRRKKYLLVLDIDETLVHSELIVEQNVPKPEKANIVYDRQLQFPNPNGTVDVYGIRFRPFLMEFLHRMSKHYDLALYTASAEDYGNAVANELDPAGNLFVARLFRQHCIHVNGVNVKSMRNFEGKDAYLIDNLIYSFPFDLDRGIPICPFVDDAMDVELKDLAEILENLPCYDSMHSLVTELLGLQEFYGFLGQKSMRKSQSQPVTPILQKHESANQGLNDRTAGTNTIYF